MYIFVGYSCSISSTNKYNASQLPWNETTSLIWHLAHNNPPLRGSYDGFLARDETTFVFLVKHLALTKSDMPSHHLSCSIVHPAFRSLSSTLPSEQKQPRKHSHSRFLSVHPFCPGNPHFHSKVTDGHRESLGAVFSHVASYCLSWRLLVCYGWFHVDLSPAGLEGWHWTGLYQLCERWGEKACICTGFLCSDWVNASDENIMGVWLIC